MKATEAKRLKELEQEKTLLKRLLADVQLDKAMLKELVKPRHRSRIAAHSTAGSGRPSMGWLRISQGPMSFAVQLCCHWWSGQGLFKTTQPPLRPPERSHHRPNPGPAARAAETGGPQRSCFSGQLSKALFVQAVVVLPHWRLRLGPAQFPHQLPEFLAGVHRLSLEELCHQSGLHPLISMLTLPVLAKPDIPGSTGQIL